MTKELGDLAEKTRFWLRIEFSTRFLDRKLLGDEAQWVEKDSIRKGEWCQIGEWLKCLKRLPGSRAAGTAKISKWFGVLFPSFCGGW